MKTRITLLILALAFGSASIHSQIPTAPDGTPLTPGSGKGKSKGKGKSGGTPGTTPPGPTVKPAPVVNPPGPAGGPGAGAGKKKNPPGPAGGPGTGVNPPGPAGGPGTGVVRKVNPPGPAGGPGTGVVRKVNPPGPAGGPGAGLVKKVNPSGPVGGPGTGVNPPGPAGGPGVGRLNSRAARLSLSIAPRRIVPAVKRPLPGVTVVAPRGRPLPRVYDRTRNVVVVQADDGAQQELPYVAVPILFALGTAQLLDDTAATDLDALASALLEIHKEEPAARFEIEGHTSTDGDDASNLQLSIARAKTIHSELVRSYGVPASMLSSQGYGEAYAAFPSGSERELQQDRRVLVVRIQ